MALESAEIYCNRRSDIDEGNKRNVIKNLETKIENLTTREEHRRALKEKLFAQLDKNGYKKKRVKNNKRKINNKKEIEEGKEEDKIKNWYGITSIGQQMESIKAILK